MKKNMVIRVSDYTTILGGRFKCNGNFSGEWFREDVLIPAMKEFLECNEQEPYNYDNFDLKSFTIDFSGLYGISEYFLDEVFVKLAYEYFGMIDKILNFPLYELDITCDEDEELEEKVKKIIKDSSYYFLYNFWINNRK